MYNVNFNSRAVTLTNKKWVQAMAILLLLLPLTALPAHADSYTVDRVGDSATDGSGNHGTLRYCVTKANANTSIGGHTIDIEVGTITLTSRLALTEPMSINGNGVTITTSGMEGIPYGCIGTNSGDGVIVSLQRIRFSRCSTKTEGGALHNSNGNVMYVLSCIFDECTTNSSGATGGAFANVGFAYVDFCTFYKNLSSWGGGGAIANYGQCAVGNSIFYGNHTTAGNAGETFININNGSSFLQTNVYDDNTGGTNFHRGGKYDTGNKHKSELDFNTSTFMPKSVIYRITSTKLTDMQVLYYEDFYGKDRRDERDDAINGKVYYSVGAVCYTVARAPGYNPSPAKQTLIRNQTPARLSVNAYVPDGGTLTYQWRDNNGNNIIGATSDTYQPPAFTQLGSFVIHCTITNTINYFPSDTYTDRFPSFSITVTLQKPSITSHPQSAIYERGAAATPLQVNVAPITDGGYLRYQWYKSTTDFQDGGTAITGATSSSYTPPTGEEGIAYYYCKVMNYLNSNLSGDVASELSNIASIVVEAHAPTYGVSIATLEHGTVSADKADYTEGETVTLTITPDSNFELQSILVAKTGDPAITVSLTEVDATTQTFTMPAYDATVTATFQKTADQTAVETAKGLVESMSDVTVAQATANTEAAVKTWLAAQINALSGVGATGITITASNITLSNFKAAAAGTAGSPSGTDGSFSFTATLTKGATTLTTGEVPGVILVTTTGIDDIPQAKPLKAYMRNGKLHVEGLTTGKAWSMYNVFGTSVYQGKATDEEADVSLSVRGVYIVVSGKRSVKAVY